MPLRSKDQRTEKASPSFANKMFPNLQPKPKAPNDGWAPKQGPAWGEIDHRARGAVSPRRTGETRKVTNCNREKGNEMPDVIQGKSDAQRIADRMKPSDWPTRYSIDTNNNRALVQQASSTPSITVRLRSNTALPIMVALTSQEDDDKDKLTGGGQNKIVSPSVRTGAPSKGASPGSADQLGQSTAFKKDQIDAGRGYNPTKFGNEIALNSKSAPGQGRTIHGCGSKVHTAQSIPATLHQPKIFSALSVPRKQKAER